MKPKKGDKTVSFEIVASRLSEKELEKRISKLMWDPNFVQGEALKKALFSIPVVKKSEEIGYQLGILTYLLKRRRESRKAREAVSKGLCASCRTRKINKKDPTSASLNRCGKCTASLLKGRKT